MPEERWPPLVRAAHNGRLEALQTAIARGDDIDLPLGTPYGTAVGATALVVAILYPEKDRRDAMVSTLLAAGADVHIAADDGSTAIMVAVQNGLTSITALLLEAGADVEGPINRNHLIHAAQKGHRDVVQLLIEAGAAVDVYSPEPVDATPLIMAAAKGHVDVVAALIAAGANVNLQNRKAVSAHVAVGVDPNAKNNKRVMTMLLDAGALPNRMEEMLLSVPCAGPRNRCEAVQALRTWRTADVVAKREPAPVAWEGAAQWDDLLPLQLGPYAFLGVLHLARWSGVWLPVMLLLSCFFCSYRCRGARARPRRGDQNENRVRERGHPHRQ